MAKISADQELLRPTPSPAPRRTTRSASLAENENRNPNTTRPKKIPRSPQNEHRPKAKAQPKRPKLAPSSPEREKIQLPPGQVTQVELLSDLLNRMERMQDKLLTTFGGIIQNSKEHDQHNIPPQNPIQPADHLPPSSSRPTIQMPQAENFV
jgi:hypothetical protein